MDAGGSTRAYARRPPLGEPREIEVRIGRDDGGAAGRSDLGKSRSHDHAGRCAAGQLRLVARIGQKAQRARIGRFQRADARDLGFRRTMKIAAQGGDHISQ